MQKGEMIECGVEALAFGGDGIARVDGMAVFVQRGLPGQRVRARLTLVKKRFAKAVVEEVLEQTPHFVEPQCPHFGVCGGCVWQDLAYSEQLAWKSRQVSDALARIGGVEPEMLEPVPSPAVFGYRNKMEFAFAGGRADEPLRLGLHARTEPGRKGQGAVFDVERCPLCSERTMDVLREARLLCQESGIAAYDPASGRGYWRHLVVRHTGTDQLMAHLITADDPKLHKDAARIVEALHASIPGMNSCVHSSRRSRNTLAFGERVHHVSGSKYIEERLLRGDTAVRYRISANSFFQTNTQGASDLYDAVLHMGGFSADQTVLDLYCGAGGVGLFLAGVVRRVVGFELSPDAVRDAYANARMNGLENCEYHAGSLEDGLNLDSLPRPDVVVCDPPRSGMHEPVVKALLALRPKRIVAVSCDPATLARDCSRLAPQYSVVRAQAVDLFAHTHHVETVAILERADFD